MTLTRVLKIRFILILTMASVNREGHFASRYDKTVLNFFTGSIALQQC